MRRSGSGGEQSTPFAVIESSTNGPQNRPSITPIWPGSNWHPSEVTRVCDFAPEPRLDSHTADPEQRNHSTDPANPDATT